MISQRTRSHRLSRPLSGRRSITENAATDSNRTKSPAFNAATFEFRALRVRAPSPCAEHGDLAGRSRVRSHAQRRHEQLHFDSLPADPVEVEGLLAAEVDEHVVAGLVRLPHGHAATLLPTSIPPCEGRVLQPRRRLHRDHTFAGFDDFRDPLGLDALMQRVAKHAWVVYSKAPFASSRHVFEYLGRYTHRVGIANSRLLAFEDGKVTFATKNGATKTLAGVDFLRRFVAHVLPPGFVKIRHYALYAGVNVHTRLSRAHLLLRPADVAPSAPRPPASYIELLLALIGRDVRRCRQCGGEVLAKGLLASVVTRPANAARAPP